MSYLQYNISNNADVLHIWVLLVNGFRGNKIAAAGVMGNIYQESGFNPINLQNSANDKLNITDEAFTKKLDDYMASAQFKNDKYKIFREAREVCGQDAVGYGLIQFTYYRFHEWLVDKAESMNKSCGSIDVQVSLIFDLINRAQMRAIKGENGIESVVSQYSKNAQDKNCFDAMMNAPNPSAAGEIFLWAVENYWQYISRTINTQLSSEEVYKQLSTLDIAGIEFEYDNELSYEQEYDGVPVKNALKSSLLRYGCRRSDIPIINFSVEYIKNNQTVVDNFSFQPYNYKEDKEKYKVAYSAPLSSSTQWCALGMMSALGNAGLKPDEEYSNNAYCPHVYNWYYGRSRFISYESLLKWDELKSQLGVDNETSDEEIAKLCSQKLALDKYVKPGDVIIFDWFADYDTDSTYMTSSSADHVGIIIDVDYSRETIVSIESNKGGSSDGFLRSSYWDDFIPSANINGLTVTGLNPIKPGMYFSSTDKDVHDTNFYKLSKEIVEDISNWIVDDLILPGNPSKDFMYSFLLGDPDANIYSWHASEDRWDYKEATLERNGVTYLYRSSWFTPYQRIKLAHPAPIGSNISYNENLGTLYRGSTDGYGLHLFNNLDGYGNLFYGRPVYGTDRETLPTIYPDMLGNIFINDISGLSEDGYLGQFSSGLSNRKCLKINAVNSDGDYKKIQKIIRTDSHGVGQQLSRQLRSSSESISKASIVAGPIIYSGRNIISCNASNLHDFEFEFMCANIGIDSNLISSSPFHKNTVLVKSGNNSTGWEFGLTWNGHPYFISGNLSKSSIVYNIIKDGYIKNQYLQNNQNEFEHFILWDNISIKPIVGNKVIKDINGNLIKYTSSDGNLYTNNVFLNTETDSGILNNIKDDIFYNGYYWHTYRVRRSNTSISTIKSTLDLYIDDIKIPLPFVNGKQYTINLDIQMPNDSQLIFGDADKNSIGSQFQQQDNNITFYRPNQIFRKTLYVSSYDSSIKEQISYVIDLNKVSESNYIIGA